MRRAKRRNPGVAGQLLVTIAATVASSLITLWIVSTLEKRRAEAALPGTLPQPIAPGAGSA